MELRPPRGQTSGIQTFQRPHRRRVRRNRPQLLGAWDGNRRQLRSVVDRLRTGYHRGVIYVRSIVHPSPSPPTNVVSGH